MRPKRAAVKFYELRDILFRSGPWGQDTAFGHPVWCGRRRNPGSVKRMEPREGIPLTRGVFVRFTTERFDGEGVPRNTEGLTLYQDDVYFPREFHLEWPDPEL